MERLSVADIVFIKFPFSDLSNSKLRPALVVGLSSNNDYILCQITSQKYFQDNSILLDKNSFAVGELKIDSFVRVDKIFTANINIIVKKVASLNTQTYQKIINKIVQILQNHNV